LTAQDNVELVRRFYAAFNANDLDGVMALCDDRIEYVNPDDAAETGTRFGAPAFRRALEGLAVSFEEFRIEVEEIHAVGDEVVVATRSTGSGRRSGIPFAVAQGHLFALRAGRVTSFRWFRTVDEAQPQRLPPNPIVSRATMSRDERPSSTS
jgi:ketosteroid isomerase-like protein